MLAFAISNVAVERDDQAVKQERKTYEGTWKVTGLQIDGNQASADDAKKITVVNGDDGTWSIRVEGKEVAKGTSEIDPTKKPKTIDFTPSEGSEKGKTFQGIYELEAERRRLCYAPSGKERPTEFSSNPGTGHVLVTFERVK
jgi:uncharacterized protein (TIGR03067 family)